MCFQSNPIFTPYYNCYLLHEAARHPLSCPPLRALTVFCVSKILKCDDKSTLFCRKTQRFKACAEEEPWAELEARTAKKMCRSRCVWGQAVHCMCVATRRDWCGGTDLPLRLCGLADACDVSQAPTVRARADLAWRRQFVHAREYALPLNGTRMHKHTHKPSLTHSPVHTPCVHTPRTHTARHANTDEDCTRKHG